MEATNRVLRKADPSTIHNKLIVGYQGWFTCAGDGPPVHQGHHGWVHWFDQPIPDGGRPTFDLFPDVSEYTPEELFPAPGLEIPGTKKPAMLFSSRHPKTVQRHFNWMAQHGIDGAFVQRFLTHCEVDGISMGPAADLMRLRDEILDRIREAAEKEHRGWAIMYDITGYHPDQLEHALKTDLAHLINDKRILDSPYYMKEKGKPVIAIWGFGFAQSNHDPKVVSSILKQFREITPGGAYLWGGVPTHWRTLKGDMDSNPEFLDVFKNELDAISPWTVGRYHNCESVDRFAADVIHPDLKELRESSHRVEYVPVIWPGYSFHNGSNGKIALNQSPREGGKFLWRQLWNVKREGVRSVYLAMFDEYDEGTAILPAVTLKRHLPECVDTTKNFPFVSLDADGVDSLTPDWYLRICGFAAEALRDERRVFEDLPKKELVDYWATRPKYETLSAAASSSTPLANSDASASAGGSGSAHRLSTPAPINTSSAAPISRPIRSNTGAWGAIADDEEGPAPPPYSLEAGSPSTPTAATHTVGTTSAVPPTAEPAANPATSSSGATGLGRATTYSAGSTYSQGATGLGRSTTYSASSATPVGTNPHTVPWAAPSFAPPMSPPPGTPGPTQTGERPPLHPASPLARPASVSSSAGAGYSPPNQVTTLPTNYSPPNNPATPASGGSLYTPSVTNLTNEFASGMNLSGAGSSAPSPGVSAYNNNPAGTGPTWSASQSSGSYTFTRPADYANPSNVLTSSPTHSVSPLPTQTTGSYGASTTPVSDTQAGNTWGTGHSHQDSTSHSYFPVKQNTYSSGGGTPAWSAPASPPPTAPLLSQSSSQWPNSTTGSGTGNWTSAYPNPSESTSSTYPNPASSYANPSASSTYSNPAAYPGSTPATPGVDAHGSSYNSTAGYSNPAAGSTGYSSHTPTSSYSNPAAGTSSYSNPAAGTSGYSNPASGPSSYSNPAAGSSSYSNPGASGYHDTTSYSNPAGSSGYQNPAASASAYANPAASGYHDTASYSNPAAGSTSYPSPATSASSYSNPAAGQTSYPNPATSTSSYSNPTSPGYHDPASYPNSATASSFPNPAAGSSYGPPASGHQSYASPGWPNPAAGASTDHPYGTPNAPPLPPRIPGYGPGHPGGFAPPPDKTFLGGFVNKATGMVDKYAGENTRKQIEKGVVSVAQTGTKLLGKLAK